MGSNFLKLYQLDQFMLPVKDNIMRTWMILLIFNQKSIINLIMNISKFIIIRSHQTKIIFLKVTYTKQKILVFLMKKFNLNLLIATKVFRRSNWEIFYLMILVNNSKINMINNKVILMTTILNLILTILKLKLWSLNSKLHLRMIFNRNSKLKCAGTVKWKENANLEMIVLLPMENNRC